MRGPIQKIAREEGNPFSFRRLIYVKACVCGAGCGAIPRTEVKSPSPETSHIKYPEGYLHIPRRALGCTHFYIPRDQQKL